MKVAERRIAEWWEAPGIDGREAFDEEVLYLNSLVEEISLPRWAILVRDRMPRWGFEPCSHRFLEGLEQVLAMIGAGRVGPRCGGCGDLPLPVQRKLDLVGRAFVRWAEDGRGGGSLGKLLGTRTPERAEAARAVGEVILAIGEGAAVVDATLDQWAERAASPLVRSLVDNEESPLTLLAQHPCAYTLLWNMDRLAHSIGNGEPSSVLVCIPALRVAPKLDPERLPTLRAIGEALARWLQEQPAGTGLDRRAYALIGPHDPVRRWLVASLYKTLKLWQVHLDKVLGEKHDYLPLI
ncbi:MAG TPA: hypothetical protein ENN53_07705 [Candidatus Acetothermia bacterium]|nr:hypothetical protein [Candidatus Acetothermia bacterium]